MTPGEQSHRCGFTEDDIRERFAQEELWDGKTEESERGAIQSLMDAGEYDNAAKRAYEAIAEAVVRYIHEVMLEKEEQCEEVDLT
jgi:hypothetical protein